MNLYAYYLLTQISKLKLVHLCLLLSDPLLHDLHLLLPVLGLPLHSPHLSVLSIPVRSFRYLLKWRVWKLERLLIFVRDSLFLLNISMTCWGRVLPMGRILPGAALQHCLAGSLLHFKIQIEFLLI